MEIVIRSNEPDDGSGDGNTSGDIELVMESGTLRSSGSGDASVTWTGRWSDNEAGFEKLLLRAERSGTGTGRTYSIEVTATDAAGNRKSVSGDLMVVAHYLLFPRRFT